jgi:hypothetical protein
MHVLSACTRSALIAAAVALCGACAHTTTNSAAGAARAAQAEAAPAPGATAKPAVPPPAAAAAAAPAVATAADVPGQAAPVLPKPDTYVVQAGDTLALIARRPEIYGDASMWLLLYRANAGQLRSVDWLCPGQVLAVPRGYTDADAKAAREEARRRAPWPPGARVAAASMCGPTPEALKAKAEAAAKARAGAAPGKSPEAAARAGETSAKPAAGSAVAAKTESAAAASPPAAAKPRQAPAGKPAADSGKPEQPAGQAAAATGGTEGAARVAPAAKSGTGPASVTAAGAAGAAVPVPGQESAAVAASGTAAGAAPAAPAGTADQGAAAPAPSTPNPVVVGTSRNAYREAARRAFAVGDIPWAIHYYREHLAKNPRDPDAMGELGNIYYRSGDLPAAAGLYYDAARILIERGNPGKASQLLLPVSEGNPALADDLYARLMAARGR